MLSVHVLVTTDWFLQVIIGLCACARIDTCVAVCSKAVLRLLDIDMGQARLPLPRITDDVLEAMRDDLTHIGFFDWALPKYL